MSQTVLVCDIGNSTLKIGLADDKRIISVRRIPIEQENSAGFSSAYLEKFIRGKKGQIKDCVAVSVVPSIDHLLTDVILETLGKRVLFVQKDILVPLENCYFNHEELGADRLVAAYAARIRYPGWRCLIVIDYGTAITFDCVCRNKFLGGLIFPGPEPAMLALSQSAEKLSNLEIGHCEFSIGRDTISCIKQGLLHGYAALTEGICNRLEKLLEAPVYIIATGGFSARMQPLVPRLDAVEEKLVLEGLRNLYFDTI